MSFLSNVRKPALLPPRIVIHGGPGVGKTTTAAYAPDPIIMPLESGEGLLSLDELPRPNSYGDVMEMLAELHTSEHGYRTLLVDTIDKLEPLVWDQVCNDKGGGGKNAKTNIEDFGFQAGYKQSDPYWIAFFRALDALRRSGMTIVVLSHTEGRTINDPLRGDYNQWTPKLHKRANALLFEWADLVGLLEIERMVLKDENGKPAKSNSTGQRILHLEDSGGMLAKNRYRLPAEIRIPGPDQGNPFDALREPIVAAMKEVMESRKQADVPPADADPNTVPSDDGTEEAV